jgi:hypothetical protein
VFTGTTTVGYPKDSTRIFSISTLLKKWCVFAESRTIRDRDETEIARFGFVAFQKDGERSDDDDGYFPVV